MRARSSPERWGAVSPHLDRALELTGEERGAWLAALRAEGLASMTAVERPAGLGKIKLLPVALPPAVAEVERRLSVIDNLEHTVEQNLARCGRRRQSLLKRAFEGRLVPQGPSDEPAARLLERIRAATDSTDRPRQRRRMVRGRSAASAGAGRRR